VVFKGERAGGTVYLGEKDRLKLRAISGKEDVGTGKEKGPLVAVGGGILKQEYRRDRE